MSISGKHWLLALFAAGAIHSLIAIAVFWQPPQIGSALQAGTGGIEVSLGSAGTATGITAEAAAVEATQAAAKAPREPEPQRVESGEPEPISAPEPAEAVAETAPPEVMPKTAPETVPETTAVAAAERRPEADGPAGADSDSSGDSQSDPGGSDGDDTAGGGLPGSAQDYIASLQAWLERHKKYPSRARRMRQQGTALLYFVMDRQGRVLQFHLQKSSGYPLLDREVAAMIKRAQPLPVMPSHIDKDKLELVVPVQFFLR